MEQLSYDDEVLLFRYLDNDMTPEERTRFEVLLKKSKRLREELEFENRLHHLGKSVSGDIRKYDNEKRIQDEDLNFIIERAKENCANAENGLNETGDVLLQGEEEQIEETGNNKRYRTEENNVRRMFPYRWVAAAAVIVLVSFVTLRYFQNANHERAIATNTSGSNASSETANKNQDNNIKERGTLPTQPNPNTSKSSAQSNNSRSIAMLPDSKAVETPESPASFPRRLKASPNTALGKKHQDNTDNPEINSSVPERLVAKNFAPDNLPSKVPVFLEDPSAAYEENKYEKAIEGYKKVIAEITDVENSELTSRGNRSAIELTSFYAHYYIAQCYMYINDTAKAIQEFENAITKAPDNAWKIKAQWYQALAYLKAGQTQKAETLLEEVAKNEQANEYKQKAVKLMEELKK